MKSKKKKLSPLPVDDFERFREAICNRVHEISPFWSSDDLNYCFETLIHGEIHIVQRDPKNAKRVRSGRLNPLAPAKSLGRLMEMEWK